MTDGMSPLFWKHMLNRGDMSLLILSKRISRSSPLSETGSPRILKKSQNVLKYFFLVIQVQMSYMSSFIRGDAQNFG